MRKLPRCPTLTLVQTFVGGCNLSLWFCCFFSLPPSAEIVRWQWAQQPWQLPLTFTPTTTSVWERNAEPQWYMTYTSAHMIGLYFTGFYCSDIHHHRRDPGCALSDTVCLSHSSSHLQLSPAPQCPLTKAWPGWSITQPVMPAPGALLPLVLALATALLQTGWVCVKVSSDQEEAVP